MSDRKLIIRLSEKITILRYHIIVPIDLMTIFVLTVIIVLAILIIERAIALIKCGLNKRAAGISPDKKKVDQLGWQSVLLIVVACSLIIFSFFAPYVFTRDAVGPAFNFKDTGPIGDTIGGLMNPFIALAGVIVTGLAFYMQYKANHLQRELFEKGQADSNHQFQIQLNYQQFESQFYEMLRLHKENVNEMELSGKKDINGAWESVIVSKRQVFQQMYLEFESLLDIVSYDHNRSLADIDDTKADISSKPLTQEQFNECYKIFFWGFNEYDNYDLPQASIKDFKTIVEDRYPAARELETMQAANLKFSIEAYHGHSAQLGHYFRHLFMMVKFVVNSAIVTNYKDKMRYLKILRAQLSNYEQIMLFYNWISGYGGSWEDKKRKFFTEYCMIHNLWYDELFDNAFIKGKVEELKNKPYELRKSTLFEIDDHK